MRFVKMLPLLLSCTGISLNAQIGRMEITIPYEDVNNEVRQSILKALPEGRVTGYSNASFCLPLLPEELYNKIKKHHLENKKLVGVKAAVYWDVFDQKGSIAGYCPLFKSLEDSVFFYVNEYKVILKEEVTLEWRRKIKEAIITKLSRYSGIVPNRNYSVRHIQFSDYACMKQVDFSRLARQIVYSATEGTISTYETYELLRPFTPNEASQFSGYIPYVDHQMEECETLLIAEAWTDSALISKNPDDVPLPTVVFDLQSPPTGDFIAKKVVAIGAVFPGKVLWAGYEEFLPTMNRPEERSDFYNWKIFEQYFDAAFFENLEIELDW